MTPAYESFWQKNARRNLWQHPLWQKFQESVGRQTTVLLNRPDEIRASALVVKHPLPGGFCWLEVPRGPLFESERLEELSSVLDQIHEYGKGEGAIFVRYSPYTLLNIPNRRLITHDHHPQTSLVLDLNVSEEELLAQMHPKGRYNIKVAEKHGVEVKPSDDVSAFYRLLTQTGGRNQFGIHGESYYTTLLESLGSHAQLLLATHGGKVIAGGLFVYLDDWGIYYYGASDYEHRELMAPYLVQWTAIREAKKRGCKHYDFLGIAPEGAKNPASPAGRHPWAGVTEFKMKFGGRVVNYPQAQEVALRPVLYRLYQWYKGIKR